MHSVIALNLRYRYRELRDARDLDMQYGVAIASLYGHPKADVKAGSKTVNDRFSLAKSRIPYYNVRTGASVEEDRERAVKMLEILRKHVTQDVLKKNKAYRDAKRHKKADEAQV